MLAVSSGSFGFSANSSSTFLLFASLNDSRFWLPRLMQNRPSCEKLNRLIFGFVGLIGSAGLALRAKFYSHW